MKKLLFKKEKRENEVAEYLRDLPALLAGSGVPTTTTPFVPQILNSSAADAPVHFVNVSSELPAYGTPANDPSSLLGATCYDPRNCDYALARYDFKMSGGSFLEIQKGDYVAIISRDEEHYLTGRNLETGELGSFPEKYVQIIRYGDLPPSYQMYLVMHFHEVFTVSSVMQAQQPVISTEQKYGTLQPVALLPHYSLPTESADGLDSRMLTLASTVDAVDAVDAVGAVNYANSAVNILPIHTSPHWETSSNHHSMPLPLVTSSSPILEANLSTSRNSTTNRSVQSVTRPQAEAVSPSIKSKYGSLLSGRVSPKSPLPQPALEKNFRTSPQSRVDSPKSQSSSPSRLKVASLKLSPSRISPVSQNSPMSQRSQKSNDIPQPLVLISRSTLNSLTSPQSAKSFTENSKADAISPHWSTAAEQHAQEHYSNEANRTRLLSLKQVGSPFFNIERFYEYRNSDASFTLLDQTIRKLGGIEEETNLTPKLLLIKYILPCTSSLMHAGAYASSKEETLSSSPVVEFPCKQAVDQLRGIFIWIAEQIVYCENPGHSDSANEVLKSRKSGSEGFANLLERLCQHINVPCIKVTGYVRNQLSDVGNTDFIPNVNHAWNVVQLHGMYFVLDAGLASPTHPLNAANLSSAFYKLNKLSEGESIRVSRHFTGTLGNMTLSKKLNPSQDWALAFKTNVAYFLGDPEAFIWTHFPLTTPAYQKQVSGVEHKLQYVKPPVSFQFFLNLPLILPQNFWNYTMSASTSVSPHLTILEPAGAFWNHDSSAQLAGVSSYGVFQAYLDEASGAWCDVVPRRLYEAQVEDQVRGSLLPASSHTISSSSVRANSARRLTANSHLAVDSLHASDNYSSSSACQARRTCLVQYIYDGLKQRRLVDIRAYSTSRDLVCISVGSKIVENALNLNPYKLCMVYSGGSSESSTTEAQRQASQVPGGFYGYTDPPINPLVDEFVHAVVTPNEFYIEQPMQYYLPANSRLNFTLHDTTFAVNVNKGENLRLIGKEPSADDFPSPLRVVLKLSGTDQLVELQAMTQKIEHENPRPEHLSHNGYVSPISDNFKAPQYFTRVYVTETELTNVGPATLVYHDGAKWRVIAEYQVVA